MPPQSVCNYDDMHSVVHRYILSTWYLSILLVILILYLSTARIVRQKTDNTMDWHMEVANGVEQSMGSEAESREIHEH